GPFGSLLTRSPSSAARLYSSPVSLAMPKPASYDRVRQRRDPGSLDDVPLRLQDRARFVQQTLRCGGYSGCQFDLRRGLERGDAEKWEFDSRAQCERLRRDVFRVRRGAPAERARECAPPEHLPDEIVHRRLGGNAVCLRLGFVEAFEHAEDV